MTVVALDAMGGDNAPAAVVQGALRAARDPGVEVLLVGREGELRALVTDFPANVKIVDAPEAVAMDASPAASVRQKPRSSINVGLDLVARGDAQAFASFGNTGAVMASSLMKLGRIRGVERPALGALFQNARGSRTLTLDVGANADCRPHYLCQFGAMGKAYFERVLHHRNPSVALLNVGEEAAKGSQFTLEAYELLARQEPNFIGNVEGKGLVEGAADVVVTDGFTGNTIVKVSEAVADLLGGSLQRTISSRLHYMLAARVLRGAFQTLREHFDYERVGGAPLFGVNGVVIIGHGRATAEAVASGVRSARSVGESGMVEAIRAALDDGPLKPAGPDVEAASDSPAAYRPAR